MLLAFFSIVIVSFVVKAIKESTNLNMIETKLINELSNRLILKNKLKSPA
jgi:hypothetical protein